MDPPKVLIIGAGLGGLALAARLAKQGYSVDVYEKNSRIGGRAAWKKKKGYTIDLGPTFLLMPGEFEELFTYCGEKFSDHIQLEPLDPLYRLHYADGTHLDMHSSLPSMRESFVAHDPLHGEEHFRSFLDFLSHEGKKFPIVYERFIARPARSIASLLFSPDIIELFRLDGFHSMWENAGAFFSEEKLRLAMSFQSMYIGESPHTAPGTYSIIPFVEFTQGVWYPRQGIRGLVEAIGELARKKGAKIHLRRPVKEIIIEGGNAIGLRLENGEEVRGDIIVSNLDLPGAYHGLIPESQRKKYTKKKLDSLKYGCSAFMIYLGVKKEYATLRHHNVFFSTDPRTNFKEIFSTRTVPGDPSIYVNVSTRTNPTLAPKGKHLLYVLVPVPYSAQRNGEKVDWAMYKEEFVRKIVDTLASRGLTQLKENAEILEVFTPDDWESLAGMHQGSTFGLSPTFLQSSVFRPNQKSEEFDRLYFVGASTHPGSGMPLVLVSARTCEKRIEDDR